jgi:RmlD substrate binding domain
MACIARMTPRPVNTYGQSRLDGEQRVAAACRQHLILRTSWLHSPWGSNFAKTMVRLASERPSIGVVDDQQGTPTYAPDLAAAIMAITARIMDDPAAIPWEPITLPEAVRPPGAASPGRFSCRPPNMDCRLPRSLRSRPSLTRPWLVDPPTRAWIVASCGSSSAWNCLTGGSGLGTASHGWRGYRARTGS